MQVICQHVEAELVVANPITCYRSPSNAADLSGSVALVQRGGGALARPLPRRLLVAHARADALRYARAHAQASSCTWLSGAKKPVPLLCSSVTRSKGSSAPRPLRLAVRLVVLPAVRCLHSCAPPLEHAPGWTARQLLSSPSIPFPLWGS